MMRCRLVTIACLALAMGSPVPARAAPPATAADADPLKPVFEALPEPERRAIQDALAWTGEFNGAVAGTFGPRTRDALLAHAKRAGVPAGAALEAPVRAKLQAEAEAARRAVGFKVSLDPRAGLAIGLPLALVPVRSTLPTGTRYASADGSIVVETAGRPTGPDGLTDVFARLTRDAPSRHVAYKLAKPDFVVVSGDEGSRKFYSRSALGVAPGGGGVLRSFTLTYPKSAVDLDRIALAVAASFDPFPAVATAAAAPPSATPSTPAPVAAVLFGEAILVAPGLALTRTDAAHCTDVEVGGAPARWQKQDPATGLALLGVAGHAAVPSIALAAVTEKPAADLLALFLVPADPDPALAAAGVTPDETGTIRAPLQKASAGVVLIDRQGALAGLTEGRRDPGLAVGGVLAAARYGVIGAAAIATFLKDAGVPVVPAGVAAMAPGEAAARWRPALLPLRCKPSPVVSAKP